MNSSISNKTLKALESPFLDLTNFKQATTKTNAMNSKSMHSPFKSVYELAGETQGYSLENETLIEIMDDLYDKEFDDMLSELAIEGQQFIQEELPYNFIQNEVIIEDKLNQHFAPLLNEFDKFINYAIAGIEQKGENEILEEEFISLIDNYILDSSALGPIEHFSFKKAWKSVKKKVKKTAKKAYKYAKKGIKKLGNIALKYVMRLLKKLFPLLIKLAYKMGIFKKIPKKYRPITDKILKKLGVNLKKAYGEKEIQYEQQQLDLYVANVFMASNLEELELIDQENTDLFQDEVVLDYNLLDKENSRTRFVKTLNELNDEESTQPAIDEFVSAIILASKVLGGRKKAVSIIGNYLGGFLSKWVGTNKKTTVKFAKHLIDKGLSKFGFEVAPESEIEDGYVALASVIEDTVEQISELPEHSFENETVLQNQIVHAFEDAVSKYMPDMLTNEQYEKRPDLKEAFLKNAVWKVKKNRKRRKKHCKFKKLNKEIDIVLTPYIANEVKTFGAVSIKNTLRDQYGYEINTETPATMHLYETSEGSNIHEIINNDVVFNKYASLPTSIIAKQLFPLTSVASGMLLREPTLGCKCKSKSLNNNKVGKHRYYYLEIPGASPQVFTSKDGTQSLRNTTALKVKLNFIKNAINLSLFLSETDAQTIASEIRQHRKENASIMINKFLVNGLKMAFSKHTTQNLSIVHPKVMPGKASGESFKLVPRTTQEDMRENIARWTSLPLSDYVLNNATQFVEAVDNTLDGVSIDIIMQAPDGFSVLKKLIGYDKVQISPTLFSEKNLEMIIKFNPGYEDV